MNGQWSLLEKNGSPMEFLGSSSPQPRRRRHGSRKSSTTECFFRYAPSLCPLACGRGLTFPSTCSRLRFFVPRRSLSAAAVTRHCARLLIAMIWRRMTRKGGGSQGLMGQAKVYTSSPSSGLVVLGLSGGRLTISFRFRAMEPGDVSRFNKRGQPLVPR